VASNDEQWWHGTRSPELGEEGAQFTEQDPSVNTDWGMGIGPYLTTKRNYAAEYAFGHDWQDDPDVSDIDRARKQASQRRQARVLGVQFTPSNPLILDRQVHGVGHEVGETARALGHDAIIDRNWGVAASLDPSNVQITGSKTFRQLRGSDPHDLVDDAEWRSRQ
jgi:hypothetical protein